MWRLSPRPYLVIGAVTLALAMLLSVIASGGFESRPAGTTAEALQRIEAKNRNAATTAAAAQRAESEVQAEAADREADLRDAGNATAPLTRFESVNAAAAAR